MEGLLLAAPGVLFELGCRNFSLWMRPLWKEGQMILCICPVCGFWNIWCWLCWRQRRVGQGRGGGSILLEKLLFLLFILKSYPEHLLIALVLKVLAFSPVYKWIFLSSYMSSVKTIQEVRALLYTIPETILFSHQASKVCILVWICAKLSLL